MAQSASSSSDGSAKPRRMPPVPNPLDLETEASATDFMQDVTQLLNDIHNEYLGLKKELKRDYNIQYSMQKAGPALLSWSMPRTSPGTHSPTRRSGRGRSMPLSSKTSSGPRPIPPANKPGSA
jgi:hypothetical protein